MDLNAGPEYKSFREEVIAFLKNFALAGGFLFVAIHGPKEWSMERKKKYVRL